MTPPARFVANLDCETTWAAEVAAARDPGARVPSPSVRLLARLSALGTLLGTLTRPGDRLWTPLPVAPDRVRPGPGTTRPRAESGPLAALPPVDRVVAWAETAQVAALRSGAPSGGTAPGHPGDWRRELRFLAPPSPGVARLAADRAVSAGLVGLPGAGWIASIDELARHLAVGGATASPRGRWVLKAPFGAAGRDRLRGSGTDVPSGDRTRLERLLALHGSLRFEPWMERTADFGAAALVGPDGVRPVGLHELEMSGGGALRAVRPLGAGDPALHPTERAALEEAVRVAGGALRALGYRGPFGVDAFRHVDARGEERFHAPCEINARLTFGFVARALAAAAGWEPAGSGRAPALHIGARRDLERAGDGAWPLLLPGKNDPVAAWLS